MKATSTDPWVQGISLAPPVSPLNDWVLNDSAGLAAPLKAPLLVPSVTVAAMGAPGSSEKRREGEPGLEGAGLIHPGGC